MPKLWEKLHNELQPTFGTSRAAPCLRQMGVARDKSKSRTNEKNKQKKGVELSEQEKEEDRRLVALSRHLKERPPSPPRGCKLGTTMRR